jgi:hypothetical protein
MLDKAAMADATVALLENPLWALSTPEVIAFDSKDFERPKFIVDPTTGQKRWAGFYSPLGLGVVFSDDKQASSVILAESEKLMMKFRIESLCPLISGTKSAMKFGFSRVIRFYDELLQSVKNCIKEAFSCHVVLPPAQFPLLDVGGVRCKRTQVENADFLRELGPAFSYLTAWYYFGKPGRGDPVCYLDSSHTSKRQLGRISQVEIPVFTQEATSATRLLQSRISWHS